MLRLLFRLSLLIFALTAVMIALAPLAAPRPVDATPAWTAYGFAACELPCWAGITVGETPFADTVALTAASVPALTSHTIAGSPVFLWGTADPYYFSGLVYLGETTVGRVELSLKLPADYLIARFGLPACVLSGPDVNQAGHLSAIYWGGADWVAAAFVNGSANGLFGPAATIYAFSVFRGNMSPCPKTTAPWRGAAAWWRYTAWIEEQAD